MTSPQQTRVHTCPASSSMPPITSYLAFLQREEELKLRTERSKQTRVLRLRSTAQQAQSPASPSDRRAAVDLQWPSSSSQEHSPVQPCRRRYEEYQESVK